MALLTTVIWELAVVDIKNSLKVFYREIKQAVILEIQI